MTIFDLVTSTNISAYWTTLMENVEPLALEDLFPNNKKRGIDLKWIKGAKGLPTVLKNSAFDVHAVPRARIGFDKLTAQMPFFKESTYIDEELRQELNMVLETGNQQYINSVMTNVFDDEVQLITSARVSRERMRAQILTTGVVAMSSNGQSYTYDYGLSAQQKMDATVKWSTAATADPIGDLQTAMEAAYDRTGTKITRVIMNTKTFRTLKNADSVKKAIYVLTNGVGSITNNMVKDFIMDQLDLEVILYDNKYADETGTATKYIPDGVATLIPDGTLGNTWFGTTPEESDLMASSVANVSIVDTGVAVTTIQKADPVNVETKVTMICLPDFPRADEIVILDTEKAIA